MKFFISAFLMTALLNSCSPRLSPKEDFSMSRAEEKARHDIASGNLRIHMAGTRGVHEAGVRREDLPLIEKLPRDQSLPVGCITPNAVRAMQFAAVYNQQIVLHLRTKEKR